MYKHILVATDGSRLSRKAIRIAVRMAKAFGAKVTGAYVVPPYSPPIYAEGAMYGRAISPKQYKEAVEREGKAALAALDVDAQIGGVACRSEIVTANTPWEGITRTAKSRKCDLIVMSSHGRRGITGLLLGSETVKVLTHSKTPVLVCR